jgi:hypothetical protein
MYINSLCSFEHRELEHNVFYELSCHKKMQNVYEKNENL